MPQPIFEHSYTKLPKGFYTRVEPAQAPAPKMIKLNRALATSLDLDPEWLASAAGLAMVSGQQLPDTADPIAMVYAGHQFGGWSPQLGDGRALLLGELTTSDERRYDLQLKGSGRTPYSRGGDGKAVLGPVLREYIVSEAMAAFGVPTTRALAAVTTGEIVYRETAMPGAVLSRIAQSHVRVGTFQYFQSLQDEASLSALADYVIARHYPEAAAAEHRYQEFLEAVIARQADLIAHWMGLGFIHGVMNTDNMQIAGETIDYGPCAFMDSFHARKVFSSIDIQGRYSWANQPKMAHWNLTRLAEALLPLLDTDESKAVAQAEAALGLFSVRFENELTGRFARKLGFLQGPEGHGDVIEACFKTMDENQVDFTLFFRHLTRVAAGAVDENLRRLFTDPTACDRWLALWRQHLMRDGNDLAARILMMQAENPIFIPRNHRVEEAIQAGLTGDFAPFHRLVKVLETPFSEQPAHDVFEQAPLTQELVHQTFCGT